ncbi:hypothetical protein QBC41DRAFT_343700 [Cercophora samala]|uniref:Uncharacterized protein n=1 Tax=Cercophora samala TaxID=330535 RepID=A0AA40DFN7_9PEZI|nr:hypothetical protein QBC41DRAFT_343700 [Cercophora samala]
MGLQFLNDVVGANLSNKFRGNSGTTPAYGSGVCTLAWPCADVDRIKWSPYPPSFLKHMGECLTRTFRAVDQDVADSAAALVGGLSLTGHTSTDDLDTVLKNEPEELVRDIMWKVYEEGMTATELCRDSGTCQKDPRLGSLVANGVIMVDQGLQLLEQSTTEESDNIWGYVKTENMFLKNKLKVLEFRNKALTELLANTSADMRIREGLQMISTKAREMEEAQELQFRDEQAVKKEQYEARGRSTTPEKTS